MIKELYLLHRQAIQRFFTSRIEYLHLNQHEGKRRGRSCKQCKTIFIDRSKDCPCTGEALQQLTCDPFSRINTFLEFAREMNFVGFLPPPDMKLKDAVKLLTRLTSHTDCDFGKVGCPLYLAVIEHHFMTDLRTFKWPGGACLDCFNAGRYAQGLATSTSSCRIPHQTDVNEMSLTYAQLPVGNAGFVSPGRDC
jgi:hypothetical protein